MSSKPPGCRLMIVYYSILWDLIIYPFHRYLLISNISSYLFIIICMFMIIKTEFQFDILSNILGLEYFCFHITTLGLLCLWNDICASTQNTWYQIILHYSLMMRSRALNDSMRCPYNFLDICTVIGTKGLNSRSLDKRHKDLTGPACITWAK